MSSTRERAFSLLEVLAVVAILAAVGLVAAVSLRPTSTAALDAAAEEVAEAIRFARSEAMRVGQPRAIRVLPDSATLEVFVPDPASATTAFGAAVADPLSKHDYVLKLRELPGASNIEVSDAATLFGFLGLPTPRDAVVFDDHGEPFHREAGLRLALVDCEIELLLEDEVRRIEVSPLGRVTVR